jgi:hypothetical protein
MTEPAPALRRVAFVLPLVLSSLNPMLRQHWAERRRQKEALGQEIMAAMGGPAHYPRPPFARALVKVVRLSSGALDPDNLAASCKSLLDCLKGVVIEDDNPRQCELVVTQQTVKRGQESTAVVIEELAS